MTSPTSSSSTSITESCKELPELTGVSEWTPVLVEKLVVPVTRIRSAWADIDIDLDLDSELDNDDVYFPGKAVVGVGDVSSASSSAQAFGIEAAARPKKAGKGKSCASRVVAKVETEEADAAAMFDKTTQENKIAKTTMTPAIKNSFDAFEKLLCAREVAAANGSLKQAEELLAELLTLSKVLPTDLVSERLLRHFAVCWSHGVG